jgi:hypothetical protein
MPNVIDWLRKDLETTKKYTREQERMELLMSMGSRSFMEEQITQLTAEAQTQNEILIEYLIKEASSKLEAIITHNLHMTRRYAEMRETVLAEIEMRMAGLQRRLESMEDRLEFIEGSIVNASRDREQDSGTDSGDRGDVGPI